MDCLKDKKALLQNSMELCRGTGLLSGPLAAPIGKRSTKPPRPRLASCMQGFVQQLASDAQNMAGSCQQQRTEPGKHAANEVHHEFLPAALGHQQPGKVPAERAEADAARQQVRSLRWALRGDLCIGEHACIKVALVRVQKGNSGVTPGHAQGTHSCIASRQSYWICA